ncbi:MAG: alpha/beta hydrolase [Cyclobacteriaceae bacterium]
MKFDKQLDLYLKYSRILNQPKVFELPVQEARKKVNSEAFSMGFEKIALNRVQDSYIIRDDGTKLKTRYYSEGFKVRKPLFIFFHGGGYVYYDIETHDTLCRFICQQLACHVLSVDYRKAPEHPFPAAYNDALLASEWILANPDVWQIDPERIIIGGDSVGGELARMVLHSLQAKYSFCLLVMLYPVVSYRQDFDSYSQYGEGYFLDTRLMDSFIRMYYHGEPEKSGLPDCQPVIANNTKAYIAVSGYDVLKDSTLAYIENLRKSGKDMQFKIFESLPHNFGLMAGKIRNAQSAMEEIGEDLRSILQTRH